MRPYPTQPDFRALYIQERSNNLRTHDRSAVVASSVKAAVEVHIYIHPSIHRRVHRKQHGEAISLFSSCRTCEMHRRRSERRRMGIRDSVAIMHFSARVIEMRFLIIIVVPFFLGWFCQFFLPELVCCLRVDVGEYELVDIRIPVHGLAFDAFFDVLVTCQ